MCVVCVVCVCVCVCVNHTSTLDLVLQEGEAGMIQHPEFIRQGQLMIQDKKGAGENGMLPVVLVVLVWDLLYWYRTCSTGMGVWDLLC